MNNKELNKKVKKLINKAWRTKKSRMNAEERLLKKDRFLKKIVINYSIFIIALSIINLKINSNIINYMLIISSLIILTVSLYRGSENLVTRARNLKNNYTEIAKLETKLNIMLLEDTTGEEFLKISDDYQDILKKCENHRIIDYQRLMFFLDNVDLKIKTKIILLKICERFFKITLLYIIPSVIFGYIVYLNLQCF